MVLRSDQNRYLVFMMLKPFRIKGRLRAERVLGNSIYNIDIGRTKKGSEFRTTILAVQNSLLVLLKLCALYRESNENPLDSGGP